MRLHLTIAGDLAERFGSGLEVRDRRVLGSALVLSILLHAVLLSIHFKFPDALRWKSASTPLEVVLVNAKTLDRPANADVVAQANLDRGGNVDEDRRAKTPRGMVLTSG